MSPDPEMSVGVRSWSRRSMTLCALFIGLFVVLMTWLGWRMIRPMNVFDVTPFFAAPIPVTEVPTIISSLGAEQCGSCHEKMYEEWQTSIHSQAWTDPYFQADWEFDRSQQICKNCHTPLAWQQEKLVVGFLKDDMKQPIFKPNPDFSQELQHEGVTCAACHYQDGYILGPFGLDSAPHPVRKLGNSNEICLRCHVAPETRSDVFVKFPLCGTVAELLEHDSSIDDPRWIGASGEIAIQTVSELNCVECHMPAVNRPLVSNGPVRAVRQHIWRGGHDPEMVKSGITISFDESASEGAYELSILNSGATHYIPTGIPDRHVKISINLLDRNGEKIDEQVNVLQRTFFWRPFIIQRSDTRLKPKVPQIFEYLHNSDRMSNAVAIEAVVSYHLLEEQRRVRIGFDNSEPIYYEIFRKKIML